MKVLGVGNQNQNRPAFGAAFIKFHQEALSRVSTTCQAEVEGLLTDGLNLFRPAGLISGENSAKKLLISEQTGKGYLRFTDADSAKEKSLVEKFLELFRNEGIETKIIENTTENREAIARETHDLTQWVSFGS